MPISKSLAFTESVKKMSEYNLKKMQKKLKKYQDEERFTHTLGVMYTSAALAMRYGCDMEKAQVAGLLHDCAKCIPNKKKIKICKKQGISLTPSEEENPFLLHAKVGTYIAAEKYHIKDEEILSAIRYHTTGKPDMTLLEKIIYVADYIEPWRNKAPNLKDIRALAFEDLDRALYVILKSTLSYLKKRSCVVDETTQEAYEYYQKLLANQKEERNYEPV